MTITQVKVIVKNKTNERKEKKGEQTSILFIKTSLLDDHTNKKKYRNIKKMRTKKMQALYP